MRKPVYAICERQRHRSACTSVQSDQHLCFLLPGNLQFELANLQFELANLHVTCSQMIGALDFVS